MIDIILGDTLQEGERLYFGNYLLSNNKCFKFTMNTTGFFQIVKLSVNITIDVIPPKRE